MSKRWYTISCGYETSYKYEEELPEFSVFQGDEHIRQSRESEMQDIVRWFQRNEFNHKHTSDEHGSLILDDGTILFTKTSNHAKFSGLVTSGLLSRSRLHRPGPKFTFRNHVPFNEIRLNFGKEASSLCLTKGFDKSTESVDFRYTISSCNKKVVITFDQTILETPVIQITDFNSWVEAEMYNIERPLFKRGDLVRLSGNYHGVVKVCGASCHYVEIDKTEPGIVLSNGSNSYHENGTEDNKVIVSFKYASKNLFYTCSVQSHEIEHIKQHIM